MCEAKSIINDVKGKFDSMDPDQQAEISAQLFLDYCIYQDQCESTRRLAPLINTVAEALTRDIEGKDNLKLGIKAVQMYLRTPPVEYFGETLSRLKFLDKGSVDEMLTAQPKDKIFGTFLMEQGVITQEQRDITVIAQKRLFAIQEVYERVINPAYKGNEAEILDNLKDVFQHFMLSTSELENDLNQTDVENISSALQRLENIITETEKESNSVLEIVDKFFCLEEDIKAHMIKIKDKMEIQDKDANDSVKAIMEKLDLINSLSLALNGTQQIQDRIGQQLLKIIPAIKTFKDQITIIAQKLKLKWKALGKEKTESSMAGYESNGTEGRIKQDDVDDLLSSLGL
jgi:chemotaxis regulatin CheY-phosphate phosphatase CheZ